MAPRLSPIQQKIVDILAYGGEVWRPDRAGSPSPVTCSPLGKDVLIRPLPASYWRTYGSARPFRVDWRTLTALLAKGVVEEVPDDPRPDVYYRLTA
jgi:hypothetical protein